LKNFIKWATIVVRFNFLRKIDEENRFSIAMAIGFGTAQAGWISYDLDQVKADAKGGSDSQAHYIRAGGSVAGFNTMMQARTASFDKGGMVHSVELTAGKQLGPVSPFVGIGHDLGFNGSKSFQYGLIGVSGGMPIGKLVCAMAVLKLV